MIRNKFTGRAALCAAAVLWFGSVGAAGAAAADSWRFCEPDYAVLVPDSSLWGNDNHHKVVNEHFHVLVSPKSGDLLAFWTQESFEGSDDMHISFARSRDGGKTWTAPRILWGSSKPGSGIANAVWQLPMFTKSGRLYCFWNEREKPGRGMGVGYMKGAYSDDDGETWSGPKVVWQPRLWCSWQRPLRLAKGGRYLTAVSVADDAVAKTCFMRFENLDDNPEIGAVKISVFMDGEKTLDGEEASIVKLPDGRLFAVMRSKFGVPLWTVSADGGETWSDAKAVVDANGRTIAHPRSPCPIYDLGGESAGSGNYFALFCDAFDAKVGQWEGRGPLYRYDGTFDAKGGQPVRFTKRDVFLKRPGSSHYGNSCYSSFTKRGDERVLWFPDNKFYLLGKVVCDGALAGGDWPFAILRSYGSYSNNVRFTERVFAAQERHPGLFNEIWFGGNDGGLDNTPEVRGKLSAEKNLGVRDRCHKLGIAFSYQQGVTLNHGSDGIRRPHIPEDAWAVNREGKKAYGLLCCTSPWTRDYLRATAREIMGRLQPDSYWPDDDMRLLKGDWHAAYLCFCDRCVKLFGESYGETFTRESLVKALNGPNGSAAVRRAWSAFNGRNLGDCTKVYREAADAVSPKTRLGIQIALSGNTVDGDSWKTMVEALAGPNGKAGTRPGGLYYTDFNPRDLPAKMILVAREAARSGALSQIGQICYEDENWPHVGGHKNAHAMMAECAWALAAGCDSIAFYWGADQNGEDAASHDFWLESVWAWRPFHLAVRDAFAGTRLGGVAAFHGANHWATKGWANHDEDELPALVACGVPVTVTEASPDALWLNERCVETLAEGDFTNVFSRPVLMSAAAFDALAKRFPKLGFTKKVGFSFRAGEKALATGKRTNGYELFPSGLRSENVKAFVRPKAADVKTFSTMTEEPGACGTCVVPTEFGGRVVIAQEVPAHWPHGVWPGSRRHAILDALDFATPGGAPARLLTDGYSVAISVRKTPDGRTAGVFLFNLGLGETPPLELVLRRGVSEDWTVSQPRRSSVAAEVVRKTAGETIIRTPPMGAYEPLLVRPN